MQRIIRNVLAILFILSFFIAANAYAGSGAIGMMVASSGDTAVAGLSCTTADDSEIWQPTTQPGTSDSGVAWVATKITLAVDTRITAYKIRESDSGADAGNVRVVLFNHDAVNDYPDETSEVANTAVTTQTSVIPATNTVIEHILASPTTVASGTYWIVDQEENSANRYVRYVGSAGNRVCYSTNAGSTWTCTADTTYDMELWGCQ